MNEASANKTKPMESVEVTTQEAPEAPPKPRTLRKWIRRILLAPIIPLTFIVGGWFYENTGRIVSTENAYVKANITPITTVVPGPVVEVAIRENQTVAAGDLLFRISPDQYQFALEAAEADLAAARLEVEGLKSDYRQYGVELKEANERIRFNELKFDRQKTLESKKFGRKVLMEEAQYNLAAARQHLNSIRERRRKALLNLYGNPDLPVGNHPSVQEKIALRNKAAKNLEDTNIYAPANGIVSNVNLRTSEYLEEGDAVFSLVETSNLWIEANLKETQLTHVHVGQDAEFVADSYPDVVWPSQVMTISPATGAEFALLPPQNASGNWVKVVQRLPVRFSVVQKEGLPELRIGMTVTVSVDTKRQRTLQGLWQETKLAFNDMREKYFPELQLF